MLQGAPGEGGEAQGCGCAFLVIAIAIVIMVRIGTDWWTWPVRLVGLGILIFMASLIWHNIQVIFHFGHGNPHLS
jgi:hypothetical protein